MTLASKLENLPLRIEKIMKQTSVPGISLAVMQGDEIFEYATGYVNLSARIEATPDSVFQIGSITKLFTTTLILQLMDEGKLDLDTTVKHYLPEFQLADNDATETITIRQLLTHTSGMDGDFFEDTGKGDDCVERYILACRALPQLHAPGEMFSYCNAGFVVAGRLIEKIDGKPWHVALKKRIIHPLSLRPMGTEPEEAILNRAAVGHMPNPESGEQMMIPRWRLSVSNGPAGATPFAAARNLLSFASLILNGGENIDGKQLLSKEVIQLVQTHQTDIPPSALGFDGLHAWGLGWMLFDWGKKRLIGHGGSTIGQNAFFRILPDEMIAVSLLTNGGDAVALSHTILSEVFGKLAGLESPPIPETNQDLNLDLSKYCGTFERISNRYKIAVENGTLMITTIGLRPPFNFLPPQKTRLEPVDQNLFLAYSEASELPTSANFLRFDSNGRPEYLHISGRASPRIS